MLEFGPSGAARAWNDYDQLISEEPGDADARTGRAFLALRTGRHAVADVELTTLVAQPADDTRRTEWLAARALARLALGRTADAATDADLAVQLAPSPGRLRVRLRVAIASGRASDLAGLDPEDLDRLPMGGRALANDLGAIAAKVGRSVDKGDEAKVRPAELSAQATLAVVYSALGEHKRALADADRAVALNPLAADVWLLRARARRRAGDADGAVADTEAGLALTPGDSRLLSLRGLLRIEQGRALEGLKLLDRALAAGGGGQECAARALALAELAAVP